MIKVENVSFHYKNSNNVLEDLNFQVQEGEIVAIVGENGSGKSTIGKLIAGILKLKRGNIIIDELEVSKKSKEKELREKVGIVFQNPENQIIFNNLYDELSFALKDLPKEEIEKRIQKALEEVEMQDLKDKDLYNLSLGQKQRIMIAEVLTKNPKYLVLDEPTTMIDSFGKEKIYAIIKRLKKQGYTIICITNLADEILLADRTLILEKGKIIAEVKKEELVEKVEIFQKHGIKIPTLLEIAVGLKRNGISIDLQEYTTEELMNALKGKMNHEK